MRLDRVLINGMTAGIFPSLKVMHLPRVQSDHCPLLVTFSQMEQHHSFFSFNPTWINHPDFMDFVSAHWRDEVHENPMVNVQLKLKNLRHLLKAWNWEVFRDFNQKICDLMQRIEAMEAAL